MLKKQALCIVTQKKQRGDRLVATTALFDPRLSEVDNTTILTMAHFFVQTLAQRVGLERAQELINASLMNK